MEFGFLVFFKCLTYYLLKLLPGALAHFLMVRLTMVSTRMQTKPPVAMPVATTTRSSLWQTRMLTKQAQYSKLSSLSAVCHPGTKPSIRCYLKVEALGESMMHASLKALHIGIR